MRSSITDDTQLTITQLFKLLTIKGIIPFDVSLEDIIDNKYPDYQLFTLGDDNYFRIHGKHFYCQSPLNTLLFYGFSPDGDLGFHK